MNPTMETRAISVTIDVPFDAANQFLSQPENMAQWAAGLGSGLHRTGGGWTVATPEGSAEVRFTEANAFGVLDHWVIFSAERTVYIPLRVIHNGGGCAKSRSRFSGCRKWTTRPSTATQRWFAEI